MQQAHFRRHRSFVADATLEHAELLLSDVRIADRNEWVAFAGTPMKLALEWTLDPEQQEARNAIALSCLLEAGRRGPTPFPLAIFGAHNMGSAEERAAWRMPEGAGLLWFAATNEGYNHLPDFAATVPAALDLMHARYPTLIAYVDDRNFIHHQWLIAMGFEFKALEHVGPFGLPFWRVERTAPTTNEDTRSSP